jgi:hypothetical protein
VLEAISRRVVDWSIDSSQTASLVVNALGMAIKSRQALGVVIHPDHGTSVSTPHGRSRDVRMIPGWFRRWDRSAIATTAAK